MTTLQEGDWLDELLDEVYQDKNQLGDFPVDRSIVKLVIQKYIDRVVAEARIDELKLLAKKLANRKPGETWKAWAWRVTDEMKNRLAQLTSQEIGEKE